MFERQTRKPNQTKNLIPIEMYGSKFQTFHIHIKFRIPTRTLEQFYRTFSGYKFLEQQRSRREKTWHICTVLVLGTWDATEVYQVIVFVFFFLEEA